MQLNRYSIICVKVYYFIRLQALFEFPVFPLVYTSAGYKTLDVVLKIPTGQKMTEHW